MSERYKILATMRKLPAFTVNELADEANASKKTVSTILLRDIKNSWITSSPVATGQPEGQPNRYSLTKEGKNAISDELETVFATMPHRDLNTATSKVPLGLMAAEKILLRYDDTASDVVRISLLEQASKNIEWAEKEFSRRDVIEKDLIDRLDKVKLALCRPKLQETKQLAQTTSWDEASQFPEFINVFAESVNKFLLRSQFSPKFVICSTTKDQWSDRLASYIEGLLSFEGKQHIEYVEIESLIPGYRRKSKMLSAGSINKIQSEKQRSCDFPCYIKAHASNKTYRSSLVGTSPISKLYSRSSNTYLLCTVNSEHRPEINLLLSEVKDLSKDKKVHVVLLDQSKYSSLARWAKLQNFKYVPNAHEISMVELLKNIKINVGSV